VHALEGEQEDAGEQGQWKSCMCWEQAHGGEAAEAVHVLRVGGKAATAVHALSGEQEAAGEQSWRVLGEEMMGAAQSMHLRGSRRRRM